MGVAHLAVELGPWNESGNRVDDQHIDCSASDEHFGDLERLFAAIGLADQQIIDIDTEGLGINVIRSAAKLIKRDRPVIVCEAATKKERQQLDRSLGPRGYKRDGSTYAKTPTYIWLPKERAK